MFYRYKGKNMKILVIKLTPLNIITSATIRTLAIIRGLLELGHNVDVLSLANNDLFAKRDYYEYIKGANIIPLNNNEKIYNNIVMNKSEFYKKYILKYLRKIYHAFNIYDHNKKLALNININLLPQSKYDLIITSSDPKISHLTIQNLKNQGLEYNKWIQYWGDPMAIDISNSIFMPKILLKYEEKHILRQADKIVYVSPFTLEAQKKLYPNLANRMFFLPVPYLEEEYYEPTNNSKFIIGYYGNYTLHIRNLIPFYNAAKQINEAETSIYGNSDIVLKSTENVKIFPSGVVVEHQKIADLLICVLNSKGTQIPGKLYHLAGTNKKVLIILDGEYKDEMFKYLSSFNRFIFCDNNEEDIRKTILDIINKKPQYNPCKKLRWNYIAQKMIDE